MKKFIVDYNEICIKKEDNYPNIYIPFSKELLDIGSPSIFAYKLPNEEYCLPNNQEDFLQFIKEYYKRMNENLYFYEYLKHININLVQINVIYKSMSCGGVMEDEVEFFIIDSEFEISNLSNEEFISNIFENVTID